MSSLAKNILGLDNALIVQCLLHQDVESHWLAMQESALRENIELSILSGWRSFEHQLKIWNAKAEGKRAVLDDDNNSIDLQPLNPLEKVQAIMRFSAVPGASRHHWGTDLDIFDAACCDCSQVELTATEAQTKFSTMHEWLDEYALEYGFIRPYAKDLGGVSPERWHFSFIEIAQEYEQQFCVNGLLHLIKNTPAFALKEAVIDNIEYIVETYITYANLAANNR